MFSYLRPKYYVGASCAIIVYDITNQDSFDDVDLWFNELSSHVPDIPIILCGNKFDLKDARSVSRDDAIAFAKLHRFDYVETSALSAYNVDKLFFHAGRLAKQFSDGNISFRDEYIV